MKENRYYQRYNIVDEKGDAVQAEIKVDGKPVCLVDFSLGGLCFLSDKLYSVGDVVNIFVNLEIQGKIDLIGKVVRVTQMGRSWSVAVDLSHSYKLLLLRKS